MALTLNAATRAARSEDPCTLSNVREASCTHLQLDWHIEFDAQRIAGTAEWSVQRSVPEVTGLRLDTKRLSVKTVHVDGNPAEFELLPEHDVFGSALHIPLPASDDATTHKVCIEYETKPDSSACQWLTAELTADKSHPYLFTQCQAIHARALLPCQDSPGCKFTYEASVSVPVWATALMSALRGPAPAAEKTSEPAPKKPRAAPSASDGDVHSFTFHQPMPIPAYLLALAVGDLDSRKVGPRSLVWSEPSMVEEVAYEFAEVERFLQAAEEITGQPYVWGQYDLLCLPPSFPYGGMEPACWVAVVVGVQNPCLTFLTPTLLAGDRSLADVVAHEVSHSWTGNLLTNRTWEHFWLNEGWTVWLERRIEARLHGESWYGFKALEAHSSLDEAVHRYGESHNFTALVPTLEDIDPDDAFSVIPYEKGFQFIHYLGELIGQAVFREFVTAYIGNFKMQTLTSADFRDFFISWCTTKGIDSSEVDWDRWLTGPGMPPVTANFSGVEAERAHALAANWLAPESDLGPSGAPHGCEGGAPEGWRHGHWLVLLDALSQAIDKGSGQHFTVARLRRMDDAYGLTASRNSEVRLRWQRLCIKLRAEFIVPHVVDFVKAQGRMKFVRPLYRDLFAWPEQAHVASETFTVWGPYYHPIARKMLAQDLKLSG